MIKVMSLVTMFQTRSLSQPLEYHVFLPAHLPKGKAKWKAIILKDIFEFTYQFKEFQMIYLTS